MKNKPIILILLLTLMIPTAASAFSWKSFFSKKAEPAPIVQEEKREDLNTFDQGIANRKYNDWDRAFYGEGIEVLLEKKDSFTISEKEMNYFINRSLKNDEKAELRDIKVIIEDGYAKVSGYSLVKNFKGNFSTELRIVSDKDNKIKVKLNKIRYRGWPIPASLVNGTVNRLSSHVFNFLYTYPDYDGVDIEMKDKRLMLKFK